MSNNLVIVESPAKAKTIEKFLGKDYSVMSSFGHVRDLAKKNLGIELENNFEPVYEVSADKKKVVTDLRKAIKQVETVWLASDEDREGEAIAWHLKEVLKLKQENTKRIVFHEITKDAILNAIENPRDINQDLVDAQQARRILDRIVGFELSPILWRKVKPSLSAGRVQSVAVRVVVEREREIINFVPQSSYKVVAQFSCTGSDGKTYKLKADLSKKLSSKEAAMNLLEDLKGADYSVTKLEKKPAKKSPAAPFTTSTLQQEASRKLSFSVSRTMMVAQRLYEAGHITYMRTDSVNLSETAIEGAKKQIESHYGSEYSKPRRFQTKAKGAQEAHEAIRPTYMDKQSISGESDQQRLYELIWKRTLASQMSEAQFERTTLNIADSQNKALFVAKGEIITFEGFLKVYNESTDDETEEQNSSTFLPPLNVNDPMNALQIDATERFSNHPPRFTEASLVKKLEDLGIGRPSTYAPTISTIQKRGYVEKEEREGKEREYVQLCLKNDTIAEETKTEITGREKGKMFPTDIGMVVNDFLVSHFDRVMSFNFTASVEEEFDEIATGSIEWREMLHRFYDRFHPKVEKTLEEKEGRVGERILGKDPESGKQVSVRIGRFGPMVQLGINDDDTGEKAEYASMSKGMLMETITLEEAITLLTQSKEGGRYLGDHPEKGKPMFAKTGRFGPYVALGGPEEETGEKPQYASLRKGQTVESVTFEEAIDLFKLPRHVGDYQEKKVSASIGRFGPYLSWNSSFTSIPKTDDPLSIELDRAIQLIEEKIEKDKARTIQLFDEDKTIKVVLDRWKKPCVFHKRRYTRIPVDVDPETLTLEDCYKLVGAEPPKKKAAKKTAAKAGAKKTKTTAKKTTTKKAATKKKTTTAKKKKEADK